jgi:hypothetical protein
MAVILACIACLIAIVIASLKFPKEIKPWESILISLLCVGGIILTSVAIKNASTYTKEYLSTYPVKAEYYEDWNEYIHKVCTSSYRCGKSTCTRVYDCSYVAYHSEYWQLVSKEGNEYHISASEYNSLVTLWNNQSFVDLNRHYHSNDGDKYVSQWDSKFESIRPITFSRQYQNKIKTSPSLLGFKKINPKETQVYDYDEISNHRLDFIYGDGDYQQQERLRQWNAYLGADKKVEIFIVIYKNKPLSSAFDQEAYWVRGNKNEFILCVGINDDSKKIEWSKVISWTPNTVLKARVEREINELTNYDLNVIIDYLGDVVSKEDGTIRKDFSEFDYIDPPISFWGGVGIFIISLLIAIGLIYWSINNDF